MSTPRLPTLTERVRAGGRRYLVAKFNGKQIAFGAAEDPESRRRFDRFVGDWIANGKKLREESEREAPALTVAALVDAYEAHAKDYYRHPDGTPTGQTTNIKASFRELRSLFSAHPIPAFTLQHLKAVREQMIARGLARKVINARIGTIRRAFSWGVEERMVPPAIAAELRELRHLKAGRTQARETPPRTPVSEADMRATLPALSRSLQALVLAMWHSGMRCGEAVQLRTCDVDMQGSNWVFRPRLHKNLWRDRPREIEIGPRAQAVLRPFLKLDPNAYWFSPRATVSEQHANRRKSRSNKRWPSHLERYERERTERVVRRADTCWAEAYKQNDLQGRRPPSPPGEAYDTRAVGHAIRRACRVSGIKPWSPHQLRHASLTRIRKELGIEAAIACGGHGSPVVTEDYTRAAARDLAKRAALELG